MARPLEKGIRYFSVDTNMLTDRKIQRVMHPYGAQSIAVILKLWSLGYEENGYYLALDKNLAFDIAFSLRLEESYVNDVLMACIEAEIFDKTLWDKYEILTSRRMQENFLTATKKRKNVEIDKKYLIKGEEETELSGEETPKEEEESTSNDKKEGETQQIKLNQTKLNKTKENKSKRLDDVNIEEEAKCAREEDEDKLYEDEELLLEDVFGKVTEYIKREYIELEKKYGWAKVQPALKKTQLMGGETINYTKKILEEKCAVSA